VPAHRGVYRTHPQTGLNGLWVELSTSPPGTLTGLAASAFPAVGNQNLSQYTTTLNNAFRALFSLEGVSGLFGVPPPGWYIGGDGKWYPLVVDVAITLSSVSPVTIANVDVREGAIRLGQLR
jgi:hypothetical protein